MEIFMIILPVFLQIIAFFIVAVIIIVAIYALSFYFLGKIDDWRSKKIANSENVSRILDILNKLNVVEKKHITKYYCYSNILDKLTEIKYSDLKYLSLKEKQEIRRIISYLWSALDKD